MSTLENDRGQEILASYARTGSLRATAAEVGMDRDTVRRVIKDQEGLSAPEQGIKPRQALRRKRFVITSALNNCPVNGAFLGAIQAYCATNKAQLLVIPVLYKNISLYSGPYVSWWPDELKEYFVNEDLVLSDNFTIMGSMKIQATAAQPLRGLAGVAKGRSAVFGHPRVALDTVATPLNKYPMVYMTTGTISEASYSATKAGRLGEFHHNQAALIVETDGEQFWWRHIHADRDGSFIDLDRHWSAEGFSDAPPATALILGDVHVGFDDVDVTTPLLHDLVPRLGVSNVVLHDVLDFFSGSHHHSKNKALQLLKELRGRDNVYTELQKVAEWFADNVRPGTKYHVIRSNHHDHLSRWLNNHSEQIDVKNLWLWHKLNSMHMEDVMAMAEDGNRALEWAGRSPFELVMDLMMLDEVKTDVNWPDDRTPFEFHGIDCGNHGDIGPNGARGSRDVFARVQRKTVIGHSHRPGIVDGCYQVGMSCLPDLPYMAGYSGWLACACIIYANGQRTLLPIINGRYCKK